MTSYMAPEEAPDSRFYSTARVASMFGVTTNTVRNWVHQGQLTCVRVNGRMRIDRDSVLKLANHKYPSVPDPRARTF